MSWKIDGKIAAHFPNASVSNRDAYQIQFVPPGGTVTDTQEIEKVYFVSPIAVAAINAKSTQEEKLAELAKYLVWRRYWDEPIQRILVAGNQNVAIEYIPSQDISVTDIGIFTNENSTGRSPRIKIFHDCGLCVAFANGDIQTTNQELYELSGSNHDAVIQATTLKAGQKYYIVYSPGYGSGNTFYPAYFQNTNGNYKVYENEQDNIQVFDISENAQYLKPSKYKGVLLDSMGIFAFATNDWFVWIGSTETGMTQGQVYRRTDVGQGWTFTGIIGDSANYHTITSSDLSNLLSKPEGADFIWYVDAVPGMNRGEIWGKPTGFDPHLVDLSTYSSEGEKEAFITYNLAQYDDVMISNGLFWYDNYIGYTVSLKSGYKSGVTSMTPLTAKPANPEEKTLYYLTASASGYHMDIVCVYENGNYTVITNENITNYFDYESLSSALEYIGTNQQLLEALYTADSTFLGATVNTDKKFYLKLNGNEV